MEKITLSGVEMFALTSAREKFLAADATFKALMNEVGGVHGIAVEDGRNWRYADDFSCLTRMAPVAPEPGKNPPAGNAGVNA